MRLKASGTGRGSFVPEGDIRQSPLTPALSPRERGQPGPALEHSHTTGFVDRLTTILPLPEGEGRGEGNGTLEMKAMLKNGFPPRSPNAALRPGLLIC
jgi:hypothetical protein